MTHGKSQLWKRGKPQLWKRGGGPHRKMLMIWFVASKMRIWTPFWWYISYQNGYHNGPCPNQAWCITFWAAEMPVFKHMNTLDIYNIVCIYIYIWSPFKKKMRIPLPEFPSRFLPPAPDPQQVSKVSALPQLISPEISISNVVRTHIFFVTEQPTSTNPTFQSHICFESDESKKSLVIPQGTRFF